jgi:hypothetical protein
MGGNVTISLGYTVYLQSFSPFRHPSSFLRLLATMVWNWMCGAYFIRYVAVYLCPLFLLYFGLTRPFISFKNVVQNNARFSSVVMVGLLLVLVVGRQRDGHYCRSTFSNRNTACSFYSIFYVLCVWLDFSIWRGKR